MGLMGLGRLHDNVMFLSSFSFFGGWGSFVSLMNSIFLLSSPTTWNTYEVEVWKSWQVINESLRDKTRLKQFSNLSNLAICTFFHPFAHFPWDSFDRDAWSMWEHLLPPIKRLVCLNTYRQEMYDMTINGKPLTKHNCVVRLFLVGLGGNHFCVFWFFCKGQDTMNHSFWSSMIQDLKSPCLRQVSDQM